MTASMRFFLLILIGAEYVSCFPGVYGSRSFWETSVALYKIFMLKYDSDITLKGLCGR